MFGEIDSNCDNEDCFNPNCTCDPCSCSKDKPCGYPERNCCADGFISSVAANS